MHKGESGGHEMKEEKNSVHEGEAEDKHGEGRGTGELKRTGEKEERKVEDRKREERGFEVRGDTV